MAYQQYKTYAAGVTGTQLSTNVDPSISPTNTTIVVYLVGTGSYSVQWSFDDFANVSDANARWFTDPQIPVGSTTSLYSNFPYNATRVRLVIVSNSAGIEMKLIQGYTIN